MRLTKRGEYALRTLIRLGVAQRFGREVVAVSLLAEGEKVPYKFLENIVAELRRAGFVESRRGKQGGVLLALPMGSIKMGSVVRAIDGRLAPIGCASDTDYTKISPLYSKTAPRSPSARCSSSARPSREPESSTGSPTFSSASP